MTEIFPLVIVALTSVAVAWAGVRWRGFRPGGLRPALGRTIELLGLTALFAALNVAVGVLIVLTLRALTPITLSLYFAGLSLVALSLVQALIFTHWGETNPNSALDSCDIRRSGNGEP